MICFELSRNGRRLATAGLPGFAVLSAIFTSVRRRPNANYPKVQKQLDFRLGGLDSNDTLEKPHVEWVEGRMKVGDVFTLRVLEQADAEPPRTRERRVTPSIADVKESIASYKQALQRLRLQLRQMEREYAQRKRSGSASRSPKR
ncbi:MAG: hypothetical protein ACXVJT_11020 [Thermoanaerobaculia bacterium]